jgi:hypothetical protein
MRNASLAFLLEKACIGVCLRGRKNQPSHLYFAGERRPLVPLLNEPKSENYQDRKDKEDDRRHPVARARAHDTIPVKTFVANGLAHAVCHTDVTFR